MGEEVAVEDDGKVLHEQYDVHLQIPKLMEMHNLVDPYVLHSLQELGVPD